MCLLFTHTLRLFGFLLVVGFFFEETGTTENSFIMALGQFHHHTVAF